MRKKRKRRSEEKRPGGGEKKKNERKKKMRILHRQQGALQRISSSVQPFSWRRLNQIQLALSPRQADG